MQNKTTKILIVAVLAAAVAMGVLYGKGMLNVHESLGSPASLKVLTLQQAPRNAPSVAFTDGAGASHALADYRGKYVLLNLWATWCAPCVAELPALARLKQQVPGMTVLAVDVTRGSTPETASSFLKSHDAAALDTLVDSQTVMMRQFKAFSLPVTLLIDPQGRIIAKAEGPAEWDAADAVAYFRKLTAS